MGKPVVFADFNNADPLGRLRMNCVGTVADLAEQGVRLREGLELTLRDGELEADGRASFSEDEHIWVAAVDWRAVHPDRS